MCSNRYKIIFLDFDGVLNNYKTKEPKNLDNLYFNLLDKKNIKVLNVLTNTTNCNIVISST